MGKGLIYFFIFGWISTIIFTIFLAVKDGFNGFHAFLLGLFVPLLGLTIVIILLSNINVRHSSSDTIYCPMNLSSVAPVNSALLGIKNGDTWTCKKCGEKTV